MMALCDKNHYVFSWKLKCLSGLMLTSIASIFIRCCVEATKGFGCRTLHHYLEYKMES